MTLSTFEPASLTQQIMQTLSFFSLFIASELEKFWVNRASYRELATIEISHWQSCCSD